MKKSFKTLISVILAVIMILSAMVIPMSAKTTKDANGGDVASMFDIQIDTNKSSYGVLGVAKITVKVTNISGNTISNVGAEAIIDQLDPCSRSSDVYAEDSELEPGETMSFTYKATLDADAVDLNGWNSFWLSFKRFFQGKCNSKAPNFDDGRAYEIASKEISFGNYDVEQFVKVWYESNKQYKVKFNLNYDGATDTIPEQSVRMGAMAVEPQNPVREGYTFIGWYSDKNCFYKFDFADSIVADTVLYAYWVEGIQESVTREEWIVALAEVIDPAVGEYAFYSFDDNSEASNADVLEAAYTRRWFELTPDIDNMVYFNPKAFATREFVAVTSTNALLYDVAALEVPEWDDVSDAIYPLNDVQSVKAKILFVEDNRFNPNSVLTYVEMHTALQAIKSILMKTTVDNNADNYVEYAEGVEESNLQYSLDETNKKVYVEDIQAVEDWRVGQVHVLNDSDESSKDVAVKITRITENNGIMVIEYEEPALEDVVESFDVEGCATQGGSFTPAEGITVVERGANRQSRASVSNTIPLWGSRTLSIDDLDTEITLDMQSIEYRFVASPSWHLISIDEVYLAVNCEVSADWQLEDIEIDDIEGLNTKIKIGDINCPLAWGFNASVEVYFTFDMEAGFNIEFSIHGKSGVQYTKNVGARVVDQMRFDLSSIKLAGTISAGLELEPGAEFLGIDLVAVGTGVGFALDGEYEPINVYPPQFCLDGTFYFYFNIYAQIGPESLGIDYTWDIFDSDNSIFRKNMHFEETGKVEECTRGAGNYKGSVVRADDTRIPIGNAKIQVIRNNTVVDTTITDAHGNFVGVSLPHGSYKLRVSCSGYVPYERSFDIIGGQTTTIETQLMVSREDEGEDGWDVRTCSGYVTNAYTGGRVSGVTIEVRTQHLVGHNDLIAVVTTDSNGYYEFEASIGQYEIKAMKDGYIDNAISVTIFNDVTNANIVLNPENPAVVDGNLRVVLKWGAYPRDLDSHMVGPENNGEFHVYYSDMNSGYVSLDTDDTTSYGPETITINQSEPGVYSYYVHDYSNRGYSDSTSMSNSGATVQLYAGNTLMYTINVPTNQVGTLWHVFDYDSNTGMITLVNEFSNQSTPSNVGR